MNYFLPESLPPREQLTLKVASAIGRSFGFRLLQDIHPIEEDKPELPNYLMKLERFDLTPMETPEPDLRYMFKHIITQEVAYGLMLHSQRRQIHESLALWYERSYEELSGFYAILAHHWSQTLVAEKAIFYLEKAGEQAVRSHALREAVQLFSEALEWLATLPDTVERKEQELRLHIALGGPLTAIKGYGSPDLIQTFTKARQLSQELGETANFFPMLWGLFAAHIGQADIKTAYELAQQLLYLAENKKEESAFLVSADNALGATLFYMGHFGEAEFRLERCINKYTSDKHHYLAFIYGQDFAVSSLVIVGLCNWLLGNCQKAQEKSQEGLDFAKQLSHPFSLCLALIYTSELSQYLQDAETTKKYAQTAIMLSIEHDFAFWIPLATILLGWANISLGETELGLIQIRQGWADYASMGAKLAQTYYMGVVASSYLQVEDSLTAVSRIDEALSFACNSSGVCLWNAELYRLKGKALIMQSKDAEAETCFHKALEVARSQGAVSLERRAIISLSEFLHHCGKTEDARQCMAQLDLNAEEFDSVDREKGMTLLAAIDYS